MSQCDDTTQHSTVRAFDLYSVQNVQTLDINDDCHLIYHLSPGVNPISFNKYIISNHFKYWDYFSLLSSKNRERERGA